MARRFKAALLTIRTHSAALLKWLVCACVAGALSGVLAGVFHLCVSAADTAQARWPWLLWLLPLGGVFIAWLYRVCGASGDTGASLALHAVHTGNDIPVRCAPLIFVSTCVTHLLGGSAGRAGAGIQLCSCVTARLGRLFRLDERERRVMAMCGISAAFSVHFGAPVAAAVFALEVISIGIIQYAAFVPCILSSLVAFAVAGALGVPPVQHPQLAVPAFTLPAYLRVLVLGLLCAAVSAIFCLLLRGVGALLRRAFPSALLRAAAGGCAVVLLTLLVGTRAYSGGGNALLAAALAGETGPEVFALKMLFTAVTLTAGFKGGELSTALCVGAAFGCLAGPLLGLPAPFAAAVATVSIFCGVVNCPLAALVLGVEYFGAQGLPFFVLALALSYMMSGYGSLYPHQRFVYDKLHLRYLGGDEEQEK